MVTRNKVISTILLFTLLLIACTRENAVQSTQVEQISELTQTSVIKETVLPKSTSTKPEREDDESVLNEYKNYEEFFTQAIKTTHWIQQISTQSTFMERTQTYTNWGVFEEWYRFDEDGKMIEYYNWITSPAEGTPEQESCLIDGRMYNVTMGSFSRSDVETDIDFTGGFAERFQNGNNLQHEQVEYQGVDAEKFSCEMMDGALEFVYVIYFDPVTQYIFGKETLVKESDGSTKLVSSTIINTFIVDAEPPLEHFERILAQLPE